MVFKHFNSNNINKFPLIFKHFSKSLYVKQLNHKTGKPHLEESPGGSDGKESACSAGDLG